MLSKNIFSFFAKSSALRAVAAFVTDPEAVEEVYQRTVAVYERVPRVPKEAIETVLKLSTAASNRNPFGVLDMSMLERIDKEGFVGSFYPGK